jgi:hypothetical protein
MTPELMKKQMTELEWQKVYDMSKDKNLYHNLCSSLFPTIHGLLLSYLVKLGTVCNRSCVLITDGNKRMNFIPGSSLNMGYVA